MPRAQNMTAKGSILKEDELLFLSSYYLSMSKTDGTVVGVKYLASSVSTVGNILYTVNTTHELAL